MKKREVSKFVCKQIQKHPCVVVVPLTTAATGLVAVVLIYVGVRVCGIAKVQNARTAHKAKMKMLANEAKERTVIMGSSLLTILITLLYP